MAYTVTATATYEDTVSVVVKGLTKATYARKLVFKYKNSKNSTFVEYATVNVAANATPAATYTRSVDALTPGNTYNFRIEVKNASTNKNDLVRERTVQMPEASGELVATYQGNLKTNLSVTGLKSTCGFDRVVVFRSNAYGKYEDFAEKFYAKNTAIGTPTASQYGDEGEFFSCYVTVHRASGKASDYSYGDYYRKIGAIKVYVPWESVPIPRIVEVTHVPPSGEVNVRWVLDSTPSGWESCHYEFYVRRKDGTETLVATVASRDHDGSITTTLDLSNWLVEEAVDVWIKAVDEGGVKYAISGEKTVALTRLFYWSQDKVQGDSAVVTAEEWNRLIAYLQAAHELFPNDFDAVTAGAVAAGDEVTAEDATSVGIGVVIQGDVVEASLFDSFVEELQLKMRSAIGA